jgi:hypothetical protein
MGGTCAVWEEPGKQKPRSCRAQEFGPKQCPGKCQAEKGRSTQTQWESEKSSRELCEKEIERTCSSLTERPQRRSRCCAVHITTRMFGRGYRSITFATRHLLVVRSRPIHESSLIQLRRILPHTIDRTDGCILRLLPGARSSL